jgi:pectate lyase
MKGKIKLQTLMVCILLLILVKSHLFSTNYDTKATENGTLNMFALTGFATVDYEITGGKGGKTVIVSDYSQLTDYASANDPYIIKIDGNVTGSGMIGINGNKTIVGVGSSALISGFGFNISGVSNVVIRNLSFTDAIEDAVNVQTSEYVWIDHCNFSNANDGLIDIKRGANYITVSWNKFSNHIKTCLLGHNNDNGAQDIGKLKVTYHHNWFNGTDQRHPRVRFGECHVFNNYYNDIGTYGIASTCDAEVLVESNYFKNVEYPAVTGGLGIESPPGYINNKNNCFENSGSPEESGSVFDPKDYYEYIPDNAEDIDSIVTAYAGAGILNDPLEFIIFVNPTNIKHRLHIDSGNSILLSIYPNPLSIHSTISFYLPESNHAILSLYDITGKKVKILADDYYKSGVNYILFRKEGLETGIYLLKLESGRFTETIKLVVE